MDMQSLFYSYWWVLLLLLSLIFYKFILRVFFGMVIVPENRIGLVTKKFVLFGANKEMPDGRIIATRGEAGFQAKALAPGLYWGMWPWQYGVDMVPFTVIPEGKIGLVLSKDGAEIPTGRILARKVDSDNFQDAEKFLDNGGQRGRQSVEIAQRTADATVKKAEGDATSLKLSVNAEAEATRLRAVAQAEATKVNAVAEAEKISKTGLAEAEKIMAIGKSTAEAYELQVKAMGGDNFTRYKVTEEIGKSQIKVIPDVLIGGGNGTEGGISGLLGLKLMEMMNERKKADEKES
jgi:uncharacterized membrane protein YqiK